MGRGVHEADLNEITLRVLVIQENDWPSHRAVFVHHRFGVIVLVPK
jgi:hypothetical protein